jgi:hypothetical protein
VVRENPEDQDDDDGIIIKHSMTPVLSNVTSIEEDASDCGNESITAYDCTTESRTTRYHSYESNAAFDFANQNSPAFHSEPDSATESLPAFNYINQSNPAYNYRNGEIKEDDDDYAFNYVN